MGRDKRAGMRFLEQHLQGLKSGKAVERRLALRSVGKALRILAKLQHPREAMCMCEGRITEALAGGGIKRGFSALLQTPKFHGEKLRMSQIKTERLQEQGFNSPKKKSFGCSLEMLRLC